MTINFRTLSFPFLLINLMLVSYSCTMLQMTFVEKKTVPEDHQRKALNLSASRYFWKNFHEGNYHKLDDVIKRLTIAYIEDPYDAITASHLGFAHTWKVTENTRSTRTPSTTDHIILAVKYFNEAHTLNPSDVRTLGFHGDMLMVEGQIDKDPKKEAQGYFNAKKVATIWPQWGGFTLSYPLSSQAVSSKRFMESIDLMWQSYDTCVGETVNRKNPSFQPYLKLLAIPGPDKIKRACWNSWIAPHNLQGFFWHFGDILVKNKQATLGRIMYENAMLSPGYKDYPYAKKIEERIRHIEKNMNDFQVTIEPGQRPNDISKILFHSSYSCTGCHQGQAYIEPQYSTLYISPGIKSQFASDFSSNE